MPDDRVPLLSRRAVLLGGAGVVLLAACGGGDDSDGGGDENSQNGEGQNDTPLSETHSLVQFFGGP